MRASIILFAIIIITSCSSEKSKMLASYEKLYDAYCHGDFKRVYDMLDHESQRFLQRIVLNESPDSLIAIASEYGLPNLAVIKYVYYNSTIKDPSKVYDFIPFIGYLGSSLFNTVNQYELYPKRSRVGDENFVTLQRMQGGARVIEWLKYTHEDGEYYLNLLYTLELNEPMYRDMVYESINQIERGSDFKYADLYKNYKNYRDINYVKRLMMQGCPGFIQAE